MCCNNIMKIILYLCMYLTTRVIRFTAITGTVPVTERLSATTTRVIRFTAVTGTVPVT